MDNTDFANRLIELRRSKGLSQKELGEMLGVSNKAVSKWENGESMPKTSTMIRLAEIMEIDGNELIGLEVEEKQSTEVQSEEVNLLRSENALLSSRLEAIESRRKRILIGVALACVVCIIASGIIAFCFTSGKRANADIKDAGQDNTKIVFSDMEFLPADGDQWMIENYYKMRDEYYDASYEKFADYYDKDGGKHQVIIGIIDKSDIAVCIKAGSKKYYYFNCKYSSKLMEPYKIDSIDFVEDEPDYYDNYYGRGYLLQNEINAFCDFYKSKGKPVDKKITELYLKRDAVEVQVSFNDHTGYGRWIYSIPIGKVFTDDDGNGYFLDYSTNEAYRLGEELTGYVF